MAHRKFWGEGGHGRSEQKLSAMGLRVTKSLAGRRGYIFWGQAGFLAAGFKGICPRNDLLGLGERGPL